MSKNNNKSEKIQEDNKYVKNKIVDAKKFISMIQHRNESLLKLVLAIVKFQNNFFYNGPKALIPLTMHEIADIIELAESTVSRLASSKYIQTEWGFHRIKYFFSSQISTIDGPNKSSESIREMIKEIILKENETKISDQKIATILQEKGIKIARRTVAKYRKMLNILSSDKRNI